jgi:hypothetical protein
MNGFSLVSSSLTCQYYTTEQMNGGGKYSSLSRYGNNYDSKKFYITEPGGLNYKTFTALIFGVS